MSFRTNRKTKKRFPVRESAGMPQSIPRVGSIISDAPDIVGFDYAGSVYVEDGDGSRYTVHYLDGHTADVEFSDGLDTDGPIDEDDETKEYRNVQVVWDGAVDFFEGYEANDPESVEDIKESLIERYGKIAKDWLG